GRPFRALDGIDALEGQPAEEARRATRLGPLAPPPAPAAQQVEALARSRDRNVGDAALGLDAVPLVGVAQQRAGVGQEALFEPDDEHHPPLAALGAVNRRL